MHVAFAALAMVLNLHKQRLKCLTCMFRWCPEIKVDVVTKGFLGGLAHIQEMKETDEKMKQNEQTEIQI